MNVSRNGLNATNFAIDLLAGPPSNLPHLISKFSTRAYKSITEKEVLRITYSYKIKNRKTK
jgi:hypothetical protein